MVQSDFLKSNYSVFQEYKNNTLSLYNSRSHYSRKRRGTTFVTILGDYFINFPFFISHYTSF